MDTIKKAVIVFVIYFIRISECLETKCYKVALNSSLLPFKNFKDPVVSLNFDVNNLNTFSKPWGRGKSFNSIIANASFEVLNSDYGYAADKSPVIKVGTKIDIYIDARLYENSHYCSKIILYATTVNKKFTDPMKLPTLFDCIMMDFCKHLMSSTQVYTDSKNFKNFKNSVINGKERFYAFENS